tara:strand:- start:872 stop:1066 length:195 start_codon:yes stop_codon:yes gene_type:complete
MLTYLQLQLTEQEKNWFADRMSESGTGRVLIPSNLYHKVRKMADNPFLDNSQIKTFLINECYNN